MLFTTTLGSFTRPDYLIQAIRDHANGKLTDSRLENVLIKATREVLHLQETAGIGIPTDGQLRWNDIITFFASGISGFQLGGLIRFFDNNLYYRKPACIAKPMKRAPIALASYRIAKKINGDAKPVLTGPFTLADLSENKFFKKKEDLISSLAPLIREEREALEKEGAVLIQIDEPALVNRNLSRDEWAAAAQALKEVSKGAKAKLFLTTYFGPVKDALPRLLDLPVQGIHVDCISFPENEKELKESAGSFGGKSLGFGCIDARNTKMEEAEKVASRVAGICKSFDPARVFLAPSAGLEFLPFISGAKKLKLLAQAARLARKEVS